jgi:hypothetical protein
LAPRFAIFGCASLTWLWAMSAMGNPTVHAAGVAWFVIWGIQTVVSAMSWFWQPTPRLPCRLPLPQGRLAYLPGIGWFGRAVGLLYPFRVERSRLADIAFSMQAAETTHTISLVIVSVLAVLLLARGSTTTAFLLLLENMLFNLYPIALQQQNLARVRHLLTWASRPPARGPIPSGLADPKTGETRAMSSGAAAGRR